MKATGQEAGASSDIMQALYSVLQSKTFEKSERARDLLSYLVREEGAGRGGHIKAYSIAIDVMGRDSSFNASADPLVRVHVGKLRELLDSYYAGEGSADPLRISIPKGSYRPAYAAAPVPTSGGSRPAPDAHEEAHALSFELRSALPERLGEFAVPGPGEEAKPVLHAAGVTSVVVRHIRYYWMAIALMLGMLTYITVSMVTSPGSRPTAGELAAGGAERDGRAQRGSRGAASREMLPRLRLVDGGGNAEVAEALRFALPRFETVRSMLGGATSTGSALDFTITLSSGGDGISNLTVDNASTGETAYSARLDVIDGRKALEEQIARALSDLALPDGVLYTLLEEEDAGNGLIHCAGMARLYVLRQTDLQHRKAYDCFKGLADEGSRTPFVFAAMSQLVSAAVADGRSHPPQASPEMAMQLAQRALEFGKGSVEARRAMSLAFSVKGDREAAVEWARAALEFNPYNLQAKADLGLARFMAGAAPAEVIPQLEAGASRPAIGYALALARYLEGDLAGAQSAADMVAFSANTRVLALMLVIAQRRGDKGRAARLSAELQNRGGLPPDPATFYRQHTYPPVLAGKLVEDLALAGLVSK